MAQNIMRPRGSENFPYWPKPPIQLQNAIPGQQMAGEVADIPINKSMYFYGYKRGDIRTIPTPSTFQDKKTAAQFIEGQPIMGRGAGVGLIDMLQLSIAQTQAQAAK